MDCLSKAAKQLREVLRVRALDGDGLRGDRVREGEAGGVEHHARHRDAVRAVRPAAARVAEDAHLPAREMGAHLVLAAGLRAGLHQHRLKQRLQHRSLALPERAPGPRTKHPAPGTLHRVNGVL